MQTPLRCPRCKGNLGSTVKAPLADLAQMQLRDRTNELDPIEVYCIACARRYIVKVEARK